MDVESLDALDKGRGHLITRPRLTRLLDESTARILLLVAPAGYGKTTLVREWLVDRPFGWYRGNQATADVAALAVGLAEAASEIVPGAGERMTNRLRTAPGTPKHDVEPLAELLAEDLLGWPADSWLVFDDYHFACDSPPSESFVELVASLCPVRFLVTSRSRPAWATAKRLLYGEVYEIGRSLLAMGQDEAADVLVNLRGTEARELVALADGWPALIGLAALANDIELPEEAVPEAIYAYFAEELYRTAQPDIQKGLRHLSLASSVTPEVAGALLGDDMDAVLANGLRLGFFSDGGRSRFDLHPLVRSFLEAKFSENRDDTTDEMVFRLGRALIERGEWDDAFSLIQKFSSSRLLVELLEAALPQMLREVRLPTLSRWVKTAAADAADSAIVNLTEAELAFRDGDRVRAEAVALQASRRLEDAHPSMSRALCIAGFTAHLRYRDATALKHFDRAEQVAVSLDARREVLWGRFVTTLDAEAPESELILQELEEISSHDIDDLLRLANGRLLLSYLDGCVNPALDAARDLLPLLSRSKDPFVLSSFLNSVANTAVLTANYAEAVEITAAEISEATKYRISFVLPHARFLRAAALWGLREFKQCLLLVGQAERAATQLKDGLVAMNTGALRARLHLAIGSPDAALEVLERYQDAESTRGMEAEYLAWWSLALACAHRAREARSVGRRALSASRLIEVSALVPWTHAILSLAAGPTTRKRAVQRAFRISVESGNMDACVAAYRASPDLLEVLVEDERSRGPLRQLLSRARDESLGARLGLNFTSDFGESLTPREREVLGLLAQGFKNKEIGGALYITEATAKAHVRHICRKLGVRSRTEAALRASELLG